ncbi:MAG TPA: TIGR03790 family protein [Bryobacteraceae bacterium]|nr:TIGR03790 family protein [Bryobacteraceae bacterium]
MPRPILAALLTASSMLAASPASVLVIVNDASPLSRAIGDYYAHRRAIPLRNICHLKTSTAEEIGRADYDHGIAAPVAAFLRSHGLTESILYIVTTAGVPLKISGGTGLTSDAASVDSELAMVYADLHGQGHRIAGPLPNPFFGHSGDAFGHPRFPIYLVTRLAAFDFPDVRGMIDRALAARNRGKFVIDLKADDSTPGDSWLRSAAARLPRERVVLDESARVLVNAADVIAYASWGSNDRNRTQRHLGFRWLPGAIVTEFVSTNARTFARPPDQWTLGNWPDPKTWFAGAPQTLTADYLHDGATGASGHVDEPYLQFTPRPDLVLPAYYRGRNLAESFWVGIPAVSWMNIVAGDPLCSLGPP